MKKQYQINKRRAINRFVGWAQGRTEPIQFALPTAEILELAQQGLGELLRHAGRLFIESVLEAEVEHLVGARSKPNAARSASRWGYEQGFGCVDGHRVPIRRPRVRSREGKELALGSYELFQRASLVEDTVWQKIMLGLTTRNYKEVVQQFSDAYGLEKSTISDHFVAASRKRLQELSQRNYRDVPLCVIILDGTIFKGEHLIVALGIDAFGRKLVLGLRQGATENLTVVSELLSELADRGVDFTVPRLYVVDGSKALRSAVVRHAGDAAFFQRCHVHKIRNVVEHLPERDRPGVKFRMRAAYAAPGPGEARNLLLRLHDELLRANPSAAASLAEGLEETLTLHELGAKGKLRQCLATTNGIESSFSVVERICAQVKRWQGGDHRLRWVGSALLFIEQRWNRLHGHSQIPAMMTALKSAYEIKMRDNKRFTVRQGSAA